MNTVTITTIALTLLTLTACGDSKKEDKADKPADELFHDQCPDVSDHMESLDASSEFVAAVDNDPEACGEAKITVADLGENCDQDAPETWDADKCIYTNKTTCWDLDAAIIAEVDKLGNPVMELVIGSCLWVAQ